MQVSIACSKQQLYKKESSAANECIQVSKGSMAPGAACTSVTCSCESTQKIMMISCTYIFSDPVGSETMGGWAKEHLIHFKTVQKSLDYLYIQTAVCTNVSPIFFDPALTQLCQTFRFALWWPAWLVDKLKPQNAQFLEGTREESSQAFKFSMALPFSYSFNTLYHHSHNSTSTIHTNIRTYIISSPALCKIN